MASRTQPKRRKVKYSSTVLKDAPVTFFERVGAKVWAGDAAGTITIRNAETGAAEHRLALPAAPVGGVVRCLRASGRQVWAGYSTGVLRILHAETGEVLKEVAAHTAGVNDFAFFDQRVYSASDDGTVAVWFSSSVHLHKRYSGHTGPVRCLWCHSDLLFSGSDDASVRAWTTGGTLKAVMNNHKGPVNAIVIKNGVLWAAAQQHSITLWDVASFKKLKVIEQHQSPVCSLLPLHDAVWSCAADRSICVWDAAGFQLVKRFGPPGGPAAAAGAAGGVLRGVLHRELWTVWAPADGGCLLLRVERSLQSECDLEGPAEAPSLNGSLCSTPRAAHRAPGWQGEEPEDEEEFVAWRQLREQQPPAEPGRGGREQEPQTEDRAGLGTPQRPPRTPAKSPGPASSGPAGAPLLGAVADALLRTLPERCREAVLDTEWRTVQQLPQGGAVQDLKYLQCLSALYGWVMELKGGCGETERQKLPASTDRLEARVEALQELLDVERRMSHEKALRFTAMQSEVQAISRSRLAMELSLEEAKAEGQRLREQLQAATTAQCGAEEWLTAEVRQLTTQLHSAEAELQRSAALREAEAQRWAAAETALQRQLQEVKEEASALALKFELGPGWADQWCVSSAWDKENVQPATHRDKKEADASKGGGPAAWASHGPRGSRTPLAPRTAASPTPGRSPTAADPAGASPTGPCGRPRAVQRRPSRRSAVVAASPRSDRGGFTKLSARDDGSPSGVQEKAPQQDGDGALTPWDAVGEKAGRSKSLAVMLDLKAMEQGWQQLTSRCHTLQLSLAESQERTDDLLHALAEKEDLLREKEEEIHLLKAERRAHLRPAAPVSSHQRPPEWPSLADSADAMLVPLADLPGGVESKWQAQIGDPASPPPMYRRTRSAGAELRRASADDRPAPLLPGDRGGGAAAAVPRLPALLRPKFPDTNADLPALPLPIRCGDLATPRGPGTSPLNSARTPRSCRTPRPLAVSKETLAALQARSPGAEATSLETALIGELGDLIAWAELVDAEREACTECLAKSEEQRTLLAAEVASLTDAILTLKAQVDDLRGRRAASQTSLSSHGASLLTLCQRLEGLVEAATPGGSLSSPAAPPADPPAPFLSPCAAHALRSPPSGHRRSPAGPPDTPDGVPDDRRMSDCLSLLAQLESQWAAPTGAPPAVPLAAAVAALVAGEAAGRQRLDAWAAATAPRGLARDAAAQCGPDTAEASVGEGRLAVAEAAAQCRPASADVALQSTLVTVTRAVQSGRTSMAEVACQCSDRRAEAQLEELRGSLEFKEAEVLQLACQVQQLTEQGAGLRRTLATRDQQVAAHEARQAAAEAALQEQRAMCLSAQQVVVTLQDQYSVATAELVALRAESGEVIEAQGHLLQTAVSHQAELEGELLSVRSLLACLPAAMEKHKEAVAAALALRCDPAPLAPECCPRCAASPRLPLHAAPAPPSPSPAVAAAESPQSDVGSALHEVEYERDAARYDVVALQTQLQEMRTQYEQVVGDLTRCRGSLRVQTAALERLQAVASPALPALSGARSDSGTIWPSPLHLARPTGIPSRDLRPCDAANTASATESPLPLQPPATTPSDRGQAAGPPARSPTAAGGTAGSPAYTTAYGSGLPPAPEPPQQGPPVTVSPGPSTGVPRAASLSGRRLYGSECGSDASGDSFRSRTSSTRSHPLATLQGSRAVRHAIDADISYIDALIRQHSKRPARGKEASPSQS